MGCGIGRKRVMEPCRPAFSSVYNSNERTEDRWLWLLATEHWNKCTERRLNIANIPENRCANGCRWGFVYLPTNTLARHSLLYVGRSR